MTNAEIARVLLEIADLLDICGENVFRIRHSNLLGGQPGNGKTLGLSELWAYQAIKDVGNYGEIFDRNLGSRSPIRLDRGLNRLSRDGGLMYAPPLR